MGKMEQSYLDLMKHVIDAGQYRESRTGISTYSIFGAKLEFDLTKGFPLFTTKRVHFKSIAHELLWFLSGSTNIKYLNDNGVTIWNEWADENGNLGPVYGKQWVNWTGHDGKGINQIQNVINTIKRNSHDRRLIVSAWNVGEIEAMALPPCHAFMQFYVDNNRGLHCQIYQRSADLPLGVPFNVASYAMLTAMIASVTDLTPARLIWIGGDTHIYENQLDGVREQITRTPYDLPELVIQNKDSIFDYVFDDFRIDNYRHHPHISFPVAV